LEQVRLLSNFETPTEKLLQILLVGQPELKAKLQLSELRQLRQRIALSCSIRPLRPEETRDYILCRLRIAAASDVGLFTEPAISRIAEYTGGIPRLVNILCDHCLLIGYADQKRRIDRNIVEQAIQYLEEGELPLRKSKGVSRQRWMTSRRWALTAGTAALVVAAATLILHPAGLADALNRIAGTFHDLAMLARKALGTY